MTKYAENLENTVRELMKSLLAERGVSLRAAAKLTGIPHNTLGEKLNRGRALNLLDLALICEAFKIRVSHLVAAAEWTVSGERPALDEPVDWQQIYQLAVLVKPNLEFNPTPKPPATPEPTQKIQDTSPLFSKRRADGYRGDLALPRMA